MTHRSGPPVTGHRPLTTNRSRVRERRRGHGGQRHGQPKIGTSTLTYRDLIRTAGGVMLTGMVFDVFSVACR